MMSDPRYNGENEAEYYADERTEVLKEIDSLKAQLADSEAALRERDREIAILRSKNKSLGQLSLKERADLDEAVKALEKIANIDGDAVKMCITADKALERIKTKKAGE
jgi:hypothetical protein